MNLAKADGSVSGVRLARAVFDACPPSERNQRVYSLMMAAEARVGSGVEVGLRCQVLWLLLGVRCKVKGLLLGSGVEVRLRAMGLGFRV